MVFGGCGETLARAYARDAVVTASNVGVWRRHMCLAKFQIQ